MSMQLKGLDRFLRRTPPESCSRCLGRGPRPQSHKSETSGCWPKVVNHHRPHHCRYCHQSVISQWWLTAVMISGEHWVHWCLQGFVGRTIGSPAQPLDWPPPFSPSSPISPGGDKQTKRTDKVKIPVQRKSWPPLGHGDWREVGCRGKSCENKTRSRGWSLLPTAQGPQRILIQISPREVPS